MKTPLSLCHRPLGWVLLASLTLGSSICAVAQAKQRDQLVSVELTREADARTIELLWAIRDGVNKQPALKYQDLLVRLDTGSQQSLATAFRDLKKGQRQYEDLNIQAAVKSLERSTMVLSGWPQYRRHACDGLYLLSRVYAGLKQPLKANQALERLVHLDDEHQLISDAPPSARKQFAAVRRRLAKRTERLKLSVSSGVAAVYVNGRSLGPTPLSLRRLSPGTHHIRLSMDGHRHWYGTIDVGRTNKKRIRMRRASRADLYRRIHSSLAGAVAAPEFTSSLSELKALASSDQAILVEPQSGGVLSAVLYDLHRKVLVRRILVQDARTPQDTADEILERLYEGLDPSALVAPLSLMDPTTSDVYQVPDWLIWGGVGVGVLAAIVLPIALLSGDEDTPKSQTGIVLEF